MDHATIAFDPKSVKSESIAESEKHSHCHCPSRGGTFPPFPCTSRTRNPLAKAPLLISTRHAAYGYA